MQGFSISIKGTSLDLSKFERYLTLDNSVSYHIEFSSNNCSAIIYTSKDEAERVINLIGDSGKMQKDILAIDFNIFIKNENQLYNT